MARRGRRTDKFLHGNALYTEKVSDSASIYPLLRVEGSPGEENLSAMIDLVFVLSFVRSGKVKSNVPDNTVPADPVSETPEFSMKKWLLMFLPDVITTS